MFLPLADGVVFLSVVRQMNLSYSLPADDRLASDAQFTEDLVQLVDTLLSATDAWSNMSQVRLLTISTHRHLIKHMSITRSNDRLRLAIHSKASRI